MAHEPSKAVTPHQHTIRLGQRHLVRIGKIVTGKTPNMAEHDALLYVRFLTHEQRHCLDEAIENMERVLLTAGFPVE